MSAVVTRATCVWESVDCWVSNIRHDPCSTWPSTRKEKVNGVAQQQKERREREKEREKNDHHESKETKPVRVSYPFLEDRVPRTTLDFTHTRTHMGCKENDMLACLLRITLEREKTNGDGDGG